MRVARFFFALVALGIGFASGEDELKTYIHYQIAPEQVDAAQRLLHETVNPQTPPYMSGQLAATKSGSISTQQAQNNEFPWIVSLQRNIAGQHVHVCDGSIVHEHLVLTSAHCLYSSDGIFDPPQLAMIGATSLDGLSNAKEKFTISDAYWPPSFDYRRWRDERATAEHDIAILRISGASAIDPVALADYDPAHGTSIITAMWGAGSSVTTAASTPSKLSLTSMTVGTPGQAPCPTLSSGNICTIGKPLDNSLLSSTCHSNDGAPQLISGTNIQIGVISFGPGSGCTSASAYQSSASIASHLQTFIRPLMAKLVDVGTSLVPVPSPGKIPSPTAPIPGSAIDNGYQNSACESYQAKVLRKRRYRRGTPVKTPFKAKSQGACATACMRNEPCMSFNYQSSTKTCILLRESWDKLPTVKDATFNAGYLACLASGRK